MTIHVESREYKGGVIQVGVPTAPVVALAKMDVMGPNTCRYEGRIGVNRGGVNLVSRLLPVERAVYSVLRPWETMVELGEYDDGDYDITRRLANPKPPVHINGKPTDCGDSKGATSVISRLLKHKGVSRMVTHEIEPLLPQVASDLGVSLHERADLYQTLSSKTGLNKAIATYNETHLASTLRPLGIVCDGVDMVIEEVARLRNLGCGAYLKLDNVRGIVAAGGLGHLAIPTEMSIDDVRCKILSMTNGVTQFDCVTQMLLKDYRVLSLSSGQGVDGSYKVYEAHEQTVDGSSADGARPICDPKLDELLMRLWDDTHDFYKQFGIVGDQNLNAMVLSDLDYQRACEVYGPEKASNIYLTDLNYRAITGTRNAMTRYQGDTGRLLDPYKDYRSRGISVAPIYAANPHVMVAVGKKCGLVMGNGGNSTIVNMGTFTPDAIVKCRDTGGRLKTQVIVQRPGASSAIDRYEALLNDEILAGKTARGLGLPYFDKLEPADLMSATYQREIARGMKEAMGHDTKNKLGEACVIQGNIWEQY